MSGQGTVALQGKLYISLLQLFLFSSFEHFLSCALGRISLDLLLCMSQDSAIPIIHK
jgi:hypothetical protein